METVNQEQTLNETTTEEKTFTQAELDAIIGDRLSRERAKYADYDDIKAKAQKFDEAEEASKSELQKATEKADALQKELDGFKREAALKEIRDKVSEETKVPAKLLTGTTEEECKAQAEAILSFASPDAYPAVKDDGEARKTGKKDTAAQFGEWFNEVLSQGGN